MVMYWQHFKCTYWLSLIIHRFYIYGFGSKRVPQICAERDSAHQPEASESDWSLLWWMEGVGCTEDGGLSNSHTPYGTLKVKTSILKWAQKQTGSQHSCWSSDLTESNCPPPDIMRHSALIAVLKPSSKAALELDTFTATWTERHIIH